jgi:hypothetical protein
MGDWATGRGKRAILGEGDWAGAIERGRTGLGDGRLPKATQPESFVGEGEKVYSIHCATGAIGVLNSRNILGQKELQP